MKEPGSDLDELINELGGYRFGRNTTGDTTREPPANDPWEQAILETKEAGKPWRTDTDNDQATVVSPEPGSEKPSGKTGGEDLADAPAESSAEPFTPPDKAMAPGSDAHGGEAGPTQVKASEPGAAQENSNWSDMEFSEDEDAEQQRWGDSYETYGQSNDLPEELPAHNTLWEEWPLPDLEAPLENKKRGTSVTIYGGGREVELSTEPPEDSLDVSILSEYEEQDGPGYWQRLMAWRHAGGWKTWVLETLWIVTVAAIVALAAVKIVNWSRAREDEPAKPAKTQSLRTRGKPAAGLPQDWADSLDVPAEILAGTSGRTLHYPLTRKVEPAWPGKSAPPAQQAAWSGAPVIVRRVAGASVTLYRLAGTNSDLSGTWAVPSDCLSRIRVDSPVNSDVAAGTETTSGSGWAYALAVPASGCPGSRDRVASRGIAGSGVSGSLAKAATTQWPQAGFSGADLRDLASGRIGTTRYAWGVFRGNITTTQVLPPPPLPQLAFVAKNDGDDWQIVWSFRAVSSSELLALAGVFDVLGEGSPQAFFAHRDKAGRHFILKVADNGQAWSLAGKESLR